MTAYKTLTPNNVRYLVVHCSATSPSMDKVDAAEIDRWHRKQGYFQIGYHYVIKRDGVIETGRKLDQPGAHARGYNHLSIGICLVGGVQEDKKTPEDNFTDEQMEALEEVLRSLRVLFPTAAVIGHGQLPGVAKACPSFDARKWADDKGI